MNFNDCIEKRKVKKTEINKGIAKSLSSLADIRFENIANMTNTTLKVESYYEIIKELMTALLSLQGYKSYSHECLISFIDANFSDKFTSMQIELIDQLRIMRNDIAYRGAFVDDDYLERNETNILLIIKTLTELTGDL